MKTLGVVVMLTTLGACSESASPGTPPDRDDPPGTDVGDTDPLGDSDPTDESDVPVADSDTDTDGDGDDDSDASDASDDTDDSDTDGPVVVPRTPEQIFGNRYWNVYRPHFLANHYEQGRVTDRIDFGTKMFGDNTVFMSLALSMFVFEYEAAGLPESLAFIHEILDAFAQLDALPANPGLGYLLADPLDGYTYRSDRGPDYTSNWCGVWASVFCDLGGATRDNEPSGDQMIYQMRALRDVVEHPGPLVHNGVDLKQLAREHGTRLGLMLKDDDFIIKNILGDEVRRGPDQRWLAWSFQTAAAKVSGLPKSTFEGTWTVLGIPVGPSQQKPYSMLFIDGALSFSQACVSGAQLDLSSILGLPITIPLECNEFNIGLASAAAAASLEADPNHPEWFSARVDRAKVIDQGEAVMAMYARYKFNDPDPGLAATAARFLDAPATPPTSDNTDPNGWCRAWRWYHDFDDPTVCDTPTPGGVYSGLDYMLPRAFASAHGEFPE